MIGIHRIKHTAKALLPNRRIVGCLQYLVHGYTPWGSRVRTSLRQPALLMSAEAGELCWGAGSGLYLTNQERVDLMKCGAVAMSIEGELYRAGPDIERFLSVAWRLGDERQEIVPTLRLAAEAKAWIEVDYTNWRGVRTDRRIQPLRVYHGSNEWHSEEQLLVEAMDGEKHEVRTFSVSGIHSITQPIETSS